MNRILLLLGLLALGRTTMKAVEPQPYRTDINPALRYYQLYLAAPELPKADQQYLFEKSWSGRTFDARFDNLITKYDTQFRLLFEAAHAQVPCDWGIDLSPGPAALLPGLAPAKSVAQTTRLRVHWHLRKGEQAQARDEFLAAFTLARNVSRDRVLVSSLVQTAMESILDSLLAETYGQWSPETLQQILDGINAAPSHGTIAQTIPTEQTAFYGWLLSRTQGIEQENSGHESQALAELRPLLDSMAGEEPRQKQLGDRVQAAGGGKLEGVLRLVRDVAPWYPRVQSILETPYPESETQMQQFATDVNQATNPLVREFFPAYINSQVREFRLQAWQAIIHAAIEYKLHGKDGLEQVKDPFGHGPFQFDRVVVQGKDRGFKLTSAYAGRGKMEALVFVEQEGPPIYVDGPKLGQLREDAGN